MGSTSKKPHLYGFNWSYPTDLTDEEVHELEIYALATFLDELDAKYTGGKIRRELPAYCYEGERLVTGETNQ